MVLGKKKNTGFGIGGILDFCPEHRLDHFRYERNSGFQHSVYHVHMIV